MTDSMSIWVLKYFIAKTQDTEIRSVLEFALGIRQTHIQEGRRSIIKKVILYLWGLGIKTLI